MSRQARRTRLARLWRYASIAALVLLLACAVLPGLSRAETISTAQAVADDGTFLPTVPRPAQPAGLCLVDTGVNLNPDTESVVVDRTAIDGGTGNDLSPTMHGTLLAMIAGAPENGWGMVGTAPQSIQIVSVRILEPEQTTFPFGYYTDGITTCLQLEQKYHIKVIDLSLGSPDVPSNQDYQAITNALQEANNYGVAVVAAAGNDDGGPLDYPAAYPSVLSVGAADTQGGAFCSFSNRGEGLRLIAPGCDLDAADPSSGEPDYNYWQGSSESSDIAASALDALMSYKPELSPQAAEEYVTNAHAGVLDIAQTFRNAGLAQLVAEGEAAEPSTKPAPGPNPVVPPQAVAPSGTHEPHRSLLATARATQAHQRPHHSHLDGTSKRSSGSGALPRTPRPLPASKHPANDQRPTEHDHHSRGKRTRGLGTLHRPLRHRTHKPLGHTANRPPSIIQDRQGEVHSMTHRRLMFLGLLTLLGASPACASASGNYEVTACNNTPEAVNNSWSWSTTDASQPSHYAEHATCPYRSPEGSGGTVDQEGGLSTTDALGLATGAPPGTSAEWTFTAPAGTTIAAINYERYLGHENDTSNYWSPALRADGTIVGGETCTVTFPNVGCLLGGPPGQGGEPGIVTALAAHQ
jgi:Subtilase family